MIGTDMCYKFLTHTSCQRMPWSGPSPDSAYLVSEYWNPGDLLIFQKMVETAQPSLQAFHQGSPLSIPPWRLLPLWGGRVFVSPTGSLPSPSWIKGQDEALPSSLFPWILNPKRGGVLGSVWSWTDNDSNLPLSSSTLPVCIFSPKGFNFSLWWDTRDHVIVTAVGSGSWAWNGPSAQSRRDSK